MAQRRRAKSRIRGIPPTLEEDVECENLNAFGQVPLKLGIGFGSLPAVKQFVTSLNLTGAAIASDNSSGYVASAWTVFVVREENTTNWNVY